MTSSTAVSLCIVALTIVSCKALLDVYKWKNTGFQDIARKAASPGFSFSQDIENILNSYSSGNAAACKEQVRTQNWYELQFGVLQEMLSDLSEKGKKIDSETYENIQKCLGKQQCEKKAYEDGKVELEKLESTYSKKLSEFKTTQINQMRDFLNKCINK